MLPFPLSPPYPSPRHISPNTSSAFNTESECMGGFFLGGDISFGLVSASCVIINLSPCFPTYTIPPSKLTPLNPIGRNKHRQKNTNNTKTAK